MSDLYKFGWFPDGANEERYDCPNTWLREKTSGPDRLVIAPKSHQTQLLEQLLGCLPEPYLLLYVLVVPRGIGEPGRYESNYSYTMVATPAAAAAVMDTGSPITSSTLTSCGFASPGSGYYASTMCFVDFSPLTGNALAAATTTGTCLEMSVQLPSAYTLYFCMNISGPTLLSNSPPLAHSLPTWTNGFLGNNVNGAPFYTNVPGAPAIYQNVQGATNTVTFSNITVVNPQGVPATGWEATSADAESTDTGESITWNSNVPLTVIPNDQTGYDTPTDPVGNACQAGAGLTGNGTTTVECAEGSASVGLKTGTAMVEAETPTTLSATMVGTGLEAITFGLMLS